MNQPSALNDSGKVSPVLLPSVSPLRQAAAWAVHAYTALGVVAGFLALVATTEGEARQAFFWMLIAVLIDATDGTLARAVDIKKVLPWFDGAKLDDIVDYFTFVTVPVAFLYYFGLFPTAGTLIFVALPLLASAYGFCQAAAKTPDFFFTGFPSYWNIVAFYLYAVHAPPWLNAAVVCVLSILVFVPIRYVYPTRTIPFRRLTNTLGGLWGIILLFLIWQLPTPPRWLVIGSLYYPLYYTALSFYLHATQPTASTSS